MGQSFFEFLENYGLGLLNYSSIKLVTEGFLSELQMFKKHSHYF